MKQITKAHYDEISHDFPIHRGNVRWGNLLVLNAMLYVAENGGKWRSLPPSYGKWNSIYRRISRWAKAGVLERILATLRERRIATISVEMLALDSTFIKVHPDAHGALKKTAGSPSASPSADGTPSCTRSPRMTGSPSGRTSRVATATTRRRVARP